MNRAIALKARQLPLLLAVVIVLSLGGTAALAGQSPAAIPMLAPPPNDNFANATLISALPFNATVNNTEATTETDEPQPCNYSNNTVWYVFTPPANTWVHVDMSGGQYETNLVVYRADSPGIGGLSSIACSSYGPVIDFQAQAGVTYYFQAGSMYGPGTLQINVQEILPPANDNFASAKVIGSLPFTDSADTRAASTESGEPTPSCGSIYRTVWYAYTPDTSGSLTISAYGGASLTQAVYTGDSLANLTEVACHNWWGPLTFRGNAATTYYIQLGNQWESDEGGLLTFNLEVAPPPVADFSYNPGDPNAFETIQFYSTSYDPGDAGIETTAWDFGDGTTSNDSYPTHQYIQDGDYTVNLTITTTDGRSASTAKVVSVGTHDVAITRLAAPTAVRVGQTRSIVVQMKTSRYPERVHVELYKSVPGGFQWLGGQDQNIPVRSGGRTTPVSFSYTFVRGDAAMGKVTFKAVATIIDKRDALPADNEAISPPTKVSGK